RGRAGQLDGAAQVAHGLGAPAGLEPLHDRLDDDEGHLRKALEVLVAVLAHVEVDLAQAGEAEPRGEVDEVADLDRVAGEEGDLLEDGAPAGVLAGERLDVARELRKEEVDERTRDELGDAAAAALGEHAALHDGPLVVGLDVADARLR